MATHTTVGGIWWEVCEYPSRREPLVQTGYGIEDGHPWRRGSCRIFRVPFTRTALAIGRWSDSFEYSDVDGVPTLSLREIAWEEFDEVQEQDR